MLSYLTLGAAALAGYVAWRRRRSKHLPVPSPEVVLEHLFVDPENGMVKMKFTTQGVSYVAYESWGLWYHNDTDTPLPRQLSKKLSSLREEHQARQLKGIACLPSRE